MKSIFLSLAIWCALLGAAHAQVIPIYFYGDSVISNKSKATSYAVYGKLSTEDLWMFKRYDLYDNLLQTGSYKDAQLTIPHGSFSFYLDVDVFNYQQGSNFKLKGTNRFRSQLGTFVNGVEQGRWITFYPDGTVLSVQDYVNGRLHGEFVAYNKYGDAEIKGNYVNGERDGLWIFQNGTQEVIYDKGVLVSSTMVKKKKGTNPIGRTNYILDEKISSVQRKSSKELNAPNPTRQVEQMMDVAEYNAANDTRYKFPKGTKFKVMQGKLVDGLEEAEWNWFYPDGKLRTSANFTKGKVHGLFTSYLPNGKVSTKGYYIENIRDGEWLVSGRKELYVKGVPKYQIIERNQINLGDFYDMTRN